MLNGKEIKKIVPYFNKILTDKQKENGKFQLKIVENQMIFNFIESENLSIVYTVQSECDNHDGLLFSYKDLSSTFSKIKVKDELDVSIEQNTLKVIINNQEERKAESVSNFTSTGTNVEYICQTTGYNLLKSIEENKVFSGKGSMDYNNNLYFSLNENTLRIYNTNDIAIVLNTIQIENSKKKYKFSIKNEYVSILYKWLTAIKNLNIKIALSNHFVFFITQNESLKVKIEKPQNLDIIINNFEKLNELNFNTIYQEKLINIKNSIIEESIKLDKENNILVLDIINQLSLDKKLFTEIIQVISEDSYINLIDNKIKTILITNIEEGIEHKIIFNTIQ